MPLEPRKSLNVPATAPSPWLMSPRNASTSDAPINTSSSGPAHGFGATEVPRSLTRSTSESIERAPIAVTFPGAAPGRSKVGAVLLRSLGLASDGVLLTLAAPIFAVWWLHRWIRNRKSIKS